MAERTFRSPNFFDREFDVTAPLQGPVGTPAGVIGTSERGPAFVPVTVGNYADYETRFGPVDPLYPASYGVQRYLDNQISLSFMRVLGAGANDDTDDIEKTRLTGQVKNAGFVVTGTLAGDSTGHNGAVQFLVAKHEVATNETLGMPVFTDNDSFTATSATDEAFIVRAAIFTTSGSRIRVLNGDEAAPSDYSDIDDLATLNSSGDFKLVLSSSDVGVSILTASLNPGSENYIAKILNTSPDKFAEKNHLLYLDFAVDDELATVSSDAGAVAILSGSGNTSDSSGDTAMLFRDAFGHFDTRFQAARTTKFISQPFGKTEYDLFHFESLDDGKFANDNIKISIANIRASTDPKNPYGTFEVQVRRWGDVDQDAEVIERFPGCNLDPRSDDYVAKKVGDRKIRYAFDADSEEERRLVDEGKYDNNSVNVRIVMTDAVERRLVPAKALPFGFRGLPTLKTNDSLTDGDPSANLRLIGSGSTSLTGSIVPPLPFRFKVTRGDVASSGFAGAPGVSEEVDGRLYWGAKLERNKNPLNPNTTKEKSGLAYAYSKLQGLEKLDALVSGSSRDSFNENKFTLARVAFSNAAVSELTGTVEEHMKEAAYIRNGEPDGTEYKVSDGVLSNRITLATLVNLTSSADFNRFQTYNKFTNVMYGGFDGVNILDKNASRMNDKGSSSDTGGGAASGYVTPGLAYNPAGEGKNNNAVFSYQTAAKIFTNPFTLSANGSNVPSINLLAIPGIKDSFITDFVADEVRKFALGMYIMDIPSYDQNNTRLFSNDSDSTTRPNVDKTSALFDGRAIDNNYVATYFPDVVVQDDVNNRRVEVPASVAALAAISFNDRVGFPWFAPAGFNRASLNFVTNIATRLTVPNRDTLYDARINPIANLPNNGGFVIFGQKTLQQNRSALDRVNVRRLMIEIKRIVSDIARRLVFEANNNTTRARFINSVVPRLGLIQTQQGIERFDVIMDERNNSDKDIEQNRLNGRIVVVPTRAIEFIAVDFVVTNAGVSFDTV